MTCHERIFYQKLDSEIIVLVI